MIKKTFLTRLTTRLLFTIPFAALLYNPSPGSATGFGPSLGQASGFAALAGTAVTCTASTVTGAVGVVTGGGFTNTGCTLTGTVHNGDAAAAAAYRDFLTAYDALHFQTPCDQTLTGTLAGVTLAPGVYCFPAAATLTGTLTLNGPADGVWIFKVGTGGTGALTGTNFSVVMSGGAAGAACPNVYWWVAQAATLTTSHFLGTILAGADITITGGTFIGDALAGGGGPASVPSCARTVAAPPRRGPLPAGRGAGPRQRK